LLDRLGVEPEGHTLHHRPAPVAAAPLGELPFKAGRTRLLDRWTRERRLLLLRRGHTPQHHHQARPELPQHGPLLPSLQPRRRWAKRPFSGMIADHPTIGASPIQGPRCPSTRTSSPRPSEPFPTPRAGSISSPPDASCTRPSATASLPCGSRPLK